MKKKAFLASAIFATSVALTSCGGGGGSSSTPPSPTPTPTPTPTPSVLAEAVVGLTAGQAGVSGSTVTYRTIQVMSDGTVNIGAPIANDSAIDINVYGIHKFANGNILLSDENRNLYLYDKAQNKIINLNVQSSWYGLDGFWPARSKYVVEGNGVFISQNGTVVTGITNVHSDTDEFLVADVNGKARIIKWDGTQNQFSAADANNPITQYVPGARLARLNSSNNVYFIQDDGTPVKVATDTLVNVGKYPLVKVGNDYYLAYDNGANVRYVKISGTTVSRDTNTITIGTNANNVAGNYGLDLSGRLFAIAYDVSNNPQLLRVYTNPSNYTVYNQTSSSLGTNLNTTDPFYLVDGLAVLKSGSNYYIGSSTGGIVALAGVPAGFNDSCLTATNSVVDRTGNKIVAYGNNCDGGNNDYAYAEISSSGITNFNRNDKWNGYNLLANISGTMYIADNTAGTIFKYNGVTSDPFTSLTNLNSSDIWGGNAGVINGYLNWNWGLLSTAVVDPNAYGGTTCPNTTPGSELYEATANPYLVDLVNDKKIQLGSFKLKCSNAIGNVGDTIFLKAANVYDRQTGYTVYGFNPITGTSACKSQGYFGNIAIKKPDGTTVTANIEAKGYCGATILGIK